MNSGNRKRLSEITALYSDLDWQYSNAMSGPYIDYRDKTDDGETVAGLKDGRITGAWRPMICVGTDSWQKSEIKRLWDISQDIYYMDFLIDGKLSEVSRFLLKKGYRARPVYTQIVDLTKSQEELHAELRKSYKSLVNKREGLARCSVGDFQELHEVVKTKLRPIPTWHIQVKMKEKGEAFCVIDRWPKPLCGSMFYTNGIWAYYASAAVLTGGNSHAVIWVSILTCGAKGCEYVELGEQVYHPGQMMMDGKPATEKHCNISLFKKGFGGKTITRLILEKQK